MYKSRKKQRGNTQIVECFHMYTEAKVNKCQSQECDCKGCKIVVGFG